MKKIVWLLIVIFLLPACQWMRAVGKEQPDTASIGRVLVPQTGTTPTHPSSRMWASLVDAQQSNELMLFGGGRLNDLWTLDLAAGQWEKIQAVNPPNLQRLGGVGAVYDARAERLVAYFYMGAGLPGETWAFDPDTNTWENLHSIDSPMSRRFTSLVYDLQSDKIILFGGVLGDDDFSPTNEVWVFDYPTNTWSQMAPSSGPSPAFFLQTVYDPTLDRMVVWGGKPLSDENLIWFYDYDQNTWTKEAYSDGPYQDYDGSMAYAPDLKRTFLYIGDQFWSYDAGSQRWEELPISSGPGKQYGASLAYDVENHQLVLFGGGGGQEKTWLYNPETSEWTVMNLQ